jgi:hypothetical protein
VHQVAVDIEQRRAVVLDVDHVVRPKLVVQGLRHEQERLQEVMNYATENMDLEREIKRKSTLGAS